MATEGILPISSPDELYPWLKPAWDGFSKQVKAQRLPHALLLSGPAGSGKGDLARLMVAALLCQQPENSEDSGEYSGLSVSASASGSGAGAGDVACGNCQSCRLLAGGAHPDYRRISFELRANSDKFRTEIIVDQIRELISTLVLTRSFSPYKVALISPAEAMNRSAANALLKTLEEPVGATVLILLSHQPARLAPTIRSRCHGMPAGLPTRDVGIKWLMAQGGVDEKLAASSLVAASGSPLVGLKLLQEGNGEKFLELTQGLNNMLEGRAGVSQLTDLSEQLDPKLLWSWLSVGTANQLSNHLVSGNSPNGVRGEPAKFARQLGALQLQADKNRRLLATSLRKDLLLQEWLIQYSRLGQ